jgi:hypothetical protein
MPARLPRPSCSFAGHDFALADDQDALAGAWFWMPDILSCRCTSAGKGGYAVPAAKGASEGDF